MPAAAFARRERVGMVETRAEWPRLRGIPRARVQLPHVGHPGRDRRRADAESSTPAAGAQARGRRPVRWSVSGVARGAACRRGRPTPTTRFSRTASALTRGVPPRTRQRAADPDRCGHLVPARHPADSPRAALPGSVRSVSLPITEEVASRSLFIPMYASLSESDQDRVIDAVRGRDASELSQTAHRHRRAGVQRARESPSVSRRGDRRDADHGRRVRLGDSCSSTTAAGTDRLKCSAR